MATYRVQSEVLKCLTPKEIFDCRKAFDQIDIDKSGFINSTELKTAYQNLGEVVTDQLVDTLLGEVAQGKETLSLEDFLNCVIALRTGAEAAPKEQSAFHSNPFFFADQQAKNKRASDLASSTTAHHQPQHEGNDGGGEEGID